MRSARKSSFNQLLLNFYNLQYSFAYDVLIRTLSCFRVRFGRDVLDASVNRRYEGWH